MTGVKDNIDACVCIDPCEYIQQVSETPFGCRECVSQEGFKCGWCGTKCASQGGGGTTSGPSEEECLFPWLTTNTQCIDDSFHDLQPGDFD